MGLPIIIQALKRRGFIHHGFTLLRKTYLLLRREGRSTSLQQLSKLPSSSLCNLLPHALESFPDPLKDPKNETPNMNPLLHWGNKGIIRGFHFLDPLGGLGLGFRPGFMVRGTPEIYTQLPVHVSLSFPFDSPLLG